MQGIIVIPQDKEHGVLSTTVNFAITTASKENGRTFAIGGISKKINSWHWHGLGRAGNKQFADFESAAKAAKKALGANIQFEEVLS